mmetsp:Transcript_75303/g.207745  ORF Transcript_75303/g.207745 Transcript_75303/m.207745 type:complete len:203 (+) Transcript_75303:2236-2844(+)
MAPPPKWTAIAWASGRRTRLPTHLPCKVGRLATPAAPGGWPGESFHRWSGAWVGAAAAQAFERGLRPAAARPYPTPRRAGRRAAPAAPGSRPGGSTHRWCGAWLRAWVAPRRAAVAQALERGSRLAAAEPRSVLWRAGPRAVPASSGGWPGGCSHRCAGTWLHAWVVMMWTAAGHAFERESRVAAAGPRRTGRRAALATPGG